MTTTDAKAAPSQADSQAPAPPAGQQPGAKPGIFIRRRSDRAVIVSVTATAVLGTIALLYFAASVFITLFSALLISFALDPFVELIIRGSRLSRKAASVITVVFAVAIIYAVAYTAWLGLVGFVAEIPTIAEKLRTAPIIADVTREVSNLSHLAEEAGKRFAGPVAKQGAALPSPQIVAAPAESVVETVYHSLGSVGSIIFPISFIPFLVYFILADKKSLTERTMDFFSGDEAERVGVIMTDIERMMRRFILGNAMIAGILAAVTVPIFWFVGLPNWAVLGILSGIASTVPYIGMVLALLPAFAVGVVTFDTSEPLVVIASSVTILHLVAANYLIPKFVGSNVHLNPTVSTFALLFFGWLWGGMGLLLGIPVVAVLKCILENFESSRSIGLWMGD